jgi:hypothetical protein
MKTIISGLLIAWFLWSFDGTTYQPRIPAVSPVGPTGEVLTDEDQRSVCLHAVSILRVRHGVPAFCAQSADPGTVLGRGGKP